MVFDFWLLFAGIHSAAWAQFCCDVLHLLDFLVVELKLMNLLGFYLK